MSLASVALAQESTPTTTVDLDGSGKKQTYTIKVEQNNEDEPFEGGTLIAGKTSLQLPDDFRGYTPDLKAYRVYGDQKQQVLVATTSSESDFTIHIIFSLVNGQLKEIGKVEHQGEMRIPGNGTLITTSWMGFWMKTEKYAFSQDLSLKTVPQEFYSVDVEGTVLKTFPVYQTRTNQKVIANTRKDSKFQVLLWDPASRQQDANGDYDYKVEWYLIKTESGFVGWVQGKQLDFENAELPWAG